MTLRCTHCQAEVILAPNNRLLTPEPTKLGIYGADGHVLTVEAITTRVRDTGLAGHGQHTCPQPQQAGLFDAQEATA